MKACEIQDQRKNYSQCKKENDINLCFNFTDKPNMMQTALSIAINLQHHMIIKNCNMLIPSGNVEKYVKEVIEALYV